MSASLGAGENLGGDVVWSAADRRLALVVALDASSSTSSPLLQAGVPTSFSRGSSKYLAAVLGAPNAAGQRREGVERAPSILRAAGIVDDIRALGWDARDLGDAHEPKPPVPSPPHGPPGPPTVPRVRKTNAWRDADAASLHEIVARRVHDAKTSGAVPLILGGDHSVAIGSVAGALRDDPALSVIWIDAHADVMAARSAPVTPDVRATNTRSPDGDVPSHDADAAVEHLGEVTVLGRGLGGYVALLLAGASHSRRRSRIGGPLERHPFSGLVPSAGELLHTP